MLCNILNAEYIKRFQNKLDSRVVSSNSEIQSTVNEMKATFDDRYNIMDGEINTIRSTIGSVKYGLTSQIRQINVSLNLSQQNPTEIVKVLLNQFQAKLDGDFTVTQNQLSSKVYQISASVEAIKNTPKAVVAFRATCAKNFPDGQTTRKSEGPGNNSSINMGFGVKDLTAHQNKIIFSHLEKYRIQYWKCI